MTQENVCFMKLSDEALAYWKACQAYRSSLTKVGQTYAVHVTIPTLQIRATNPRILHQLALIMTQEGVEHADECVV